MTLDEIIHTQATVALPMIGADKTLATEVQTLLAAIGVLDPPADGAFGPVSHWALAQVVKRLRIAGTPVLDRWLAQALIDAAASGTLFPLKTPASLEGRLVEAMLAAKQWISRHPDCVNVVYVEGMDADGTANDDAPNVFNDLRLVLRVNRTGNPEIVQRWDATTEPGKYYTSVRKLDPRGATRIAFGQYKAWSVGMHRAGTPTAHEALVQTAPISVFRDLNEDFERRGDAEVDGLFGINQHWGYDLPKSDIGRASAGCLVGRTKSGHRAFMKLCKADPRYVANN
ncbi:MAG: peptidoglycan-binding protein, partial [Gammaproteobacteria bacterium]